MSHGKILWAQSEVGMYYRVVRSNDHQAYFIAQRVNAQGKVQGGYVENPNPTGPKDWLFDSESSAIAVAEGLGLTPYTGESQRSFASLPTAHDQE